MLVSWAPHPPLTPQHRQGSRRQECEGPSLLTGQRPPAPPNPAPAPPSTPHPRTAGTSCDSAPAPSALGRVGDPREAPPATPGTMGTPGRSVPSTSSRCPCTRRAAAASERGSVTSSCRTSSVSGQQPPRCASSCSPLATSRMVANTAGESAATRTDATELPTPGTTEDPRGWQPPWRSVTPLPLNLRAPSAARRAARPSPMPEEQPVISTVVFSMGRRCRPRGPRCLKGMGGGDPRPPPRVLCLLPYLKAPPPTSLCLDACAAAAIKTPRSQDPPAGGDPGAQGGWQSQRQPRRARHPVSPAMQAQGPSAAPLPRFVLVPRWGAEMDTHGRKERPAARPLIALQAGGPQSCLPAPRPGSASAPQLGEKALKTPFQGAQPQRHRRKLCKFSFGTKGTKCGQGRVAEGPCGHWGPRSAQDHPRGEAGSPFPLGQGLLCAPRCRLPGCFSTITVPTGQQGQGQVSPVPLHSPSSP